MVTTQSLAILLIQYTFREPLKYKINVVCWITLKPHHVVDISPFFPQFYFIKISITLNQITRNGYETTKLAYDFTIVIQITCDSTT